MTTKGRDVLNREDSWPPTQINQQEEQQQLDLPKQVKRIEAKRIEVKNGSEQSLTTKQCPIEKRRFSSHEPYTPLLSIDYFWPQLCPAGGLPAGQPL